MGVMGGALSVRRFRVAGELPEGWREIYRDRLEEFAFRTPPHEVGKEEVEGWVQVHNLLDTEFTDFGRWLYNEIAVFAIRVDKKRLPARLFAATLEKRGDAWKAERGVERLPSTVRTELKDALELEWLQQTLPTVAVTECAWHVAEGWLILHGMSEGIVDRFRKRFFRTFALRLIPWSPLDMLDDPELVDAMLTRPPSVFAEASVLKGWDDV